jgi:hypothetical protein
MILVFKLIVTPFFIGAVTLAGRRWGPTVSGMLMGLPLTSGPISVFLALQYGAGFAIRSATGNLAGQVSVCIFCLVYSLSARRTNWIGSLLMALGAFMVATFIWNQFTLTLLSAVLLLGAAIPFTMLLMPKGNVGDETFIPPAWDLPARMILATTFLLALTTFADSLGPHLSGLIAPLPIYGSVFAAFTHRQQGADAVAQLLRGVVAGSLAYAAFFLVAGGLLADHSIGWTYLLASMAAVCISGLVFYLPRWVHPEKILQKKLPSTDDDNE